MEQNRVLTSEMQDIYRDFFVKYRLRVIRFIAKYGHGSYRAFHEVEELADEILDQFVAEDRLGNHPFAFDSTMFYIDENGNEKKVAFTTYLYSYVKRRIYNRRQVLNKQDRTVSLYRLVRSEDNETLQLVNLIEDKRNVPGPFQTEEFVSKITDVHNELTRLGSTDRKNLAVFFLDVVKQVVYEEKLDKRRLAKQWGVSYATICNWLAELRRFPKLKEILKG